jgi:hypothetical protein
MGDSRGKRDGEEQGGKGPHDGSRQRTLEKDEKEQREARQGN